MSQIYIKRKLPAFVDASTKSLRLGFLSSGYYEVLRDHLDFPDSDTDYTQVKSDLGDVWICSRWKEEVYVKRPAATPEINADEAISESQLLANLEAYNVSTYSLDDPHYPFVLNGVGLPQAPPSQNNCCTFVEGLIVKSKQDADPDFPWDIAKHNDMMITSKDDLFSPITQAVSSGLAVEIDQDQPHPWTIIQGWRAEFKGGHTFIIVHHDLKTDKVLTLESNKYYGLNGVGFRGLGNSDQFGNKVPEDWTKNPKVFTWARIKKTYPNYKIAALKVKDLSWVS